MHVPGEGGGSGLNERGSSQPLGTRSIWSIIIICILFYLLVGVIRVYVVM